MNRGRIILLVFLPALLFTLTVILIYNNYELRSGLKNTVVTLAARVDDFNADLSQNTTVVSHQVDALATVMSTTREAEVPVMLEKIMKTFPQICGIVVSYDPDFLDGMKKGKYSDYSLQKLFGKKHVPGSEVPALFSVGLQRDEQGKLHFFNDAVNNYSTKEGFLSQKYSQKSLWTPPYTPSDYPRMVCTYVTSFYYQGIFAGVVACRVEILDLIGMRKIRGFQHIGANGGRFFIVDNQGRIIFHSQGLGLSRCSLYSMVSDVGHSEICGQIDYVINEKKGIVRTPYLNIKQETDDRGDEFTTYIFSQLNDLTNWTLVCAFDETAAMAGTRSRLFILNWVTFLSILLICLIISISLIRASKPLYEMISVAQKVSSGDFNARVASHFAKRGGRLGEFARAFNQMTEHLGDLVAQRGQELAIRTNIERELEISKGLQQSFLPANRFLFSPERGYSIQGNLVPAKYVAGDFFDFWRINDETIGIVIADVSGKGVPAAMVMVAASTLLRQVTAKISSPTPGEVVTEVNRLLMKRDKMNMFITLFLAFYNPKTGDFHYCNAGHNSPVIVSGNGETRMLGYANFPVVGVIDDLKYESQSDNLAAGELLFLYTDGVTDAVSDTGEQFGETRLLDMLTQCSSLPTGLFFISAEKTLKDYQGAVQADDITMLVLRRTADIAKEWTCRQKVAFGDTKLIIDVTNAMKSKKWPDIPIKEVAESLRKVINYINILNQRTGTTLELDVACCISETVVSFAVRNRDGWLRAEELEVHDDWGVVEITASCVHNELIRYINDKMTMVWFNNTKTALFMEKYRSCPSLCDPDNIDLRHVTRE